MFAFAARPLIDGYADFVQLLPVAGSRRHGGPGGQLLRGFATALRALDHRRGQILPRGAAPEIIGAHAPRWTYAVFAAALLRDVPKVCTGLRVWLNLGGHWSEPWDPGVGAMRARGARRYRIETLPPEVPSAPVDSALAVRMFERCVPPVIQTWLCEDAALMTELRWVLSNRGDPASAIGELVARAATGSARARTATPPAPVQRRPLSGPGEPSADATRVLPAAVEPEYLDAVQPEGSELGHRFMHWLQQGISGGTLSVNAPGALVHGVDDGLLLVSPRIFREFARHQGADGGTPAPGAERSRDAVRRIQREVLRAGWHLQAERGVNMLCYECKREGRAPSRISGIVIREPGRFVDPPPAINPALARVLEGASSADS